MLLILDSVAVQPSDFGACLYLENSMFLMTIIFDSVISFKGVKFAIIITESLLLNQSSLDDRWNQMEPDVTDGTRCYR